MKSRRTSGRELFRVYDSGGDVLHIQFSQDIATEEVDFRGIAFSVSRKVLFHDD